MIPVRMEQYPVGQGGLFTGEIGSLPHCVYWAYDCGSNQDDALVREIARASAPGERDLLLLSHLDSDHVSGVDMPAQGPIPTAILISRCASPSNEMGSAICESATNAAAPSSGMWR